MIPRHLRVSPNARVTAIEPREHPMSHVVRICLMLGLILTALLAAPVAAETAAATVKPAYQPRPFAGWRIHVHDDLLRRQPAETDAALTLLHGQLRTIEEVVPAAAVVRLKQVSMWFSPEYPGVNPKAEYHPGLDWLTEAKRDPCLHRGVEFTNVSIFAAECERMPMLALHELAHAYHDQVLDFQHVELLAAYVNAKNTGIYDRVERRGINGRPATWERAYAMTTVQEYFAEGSEAFFGRNDFSPFTRDELKRHDPDLERLLIRLWNPKP